MPLVVAAALVPLGAWLAGTRPPRPDRSGRPPRLIPVPALVALAAGVGCVGGIYGIGGGSILAPALIGSGWPPGEVAPAALASTFVTSVAGVITFTVLSLHQPSPVVRGNPQRVAGMVIEPGQDLGAGPPGERVVGEVGLPALAGLPSGEPDVRRPRPLARLGVTSPARLTTGELR